MKILSPKHLLLPVFLFHSICDAQVSILSEGFNQITNNAVNPVPGWTAINNSEGNAHPDATKWYEASFWLPPFVGQSGPAEGSDCLIASYSSAQSPTGVTISNWLISPELNLTNGAVVKFWTATTPLGIFLADRLQVRLSTAGNSLNVGSDPESLGDFNILLTDINPNYIWDDVAFGGYPKSWKEYSFILSGIPANTSGRIGFRYYVTDAGANGNNSFAAMIDQFSYVSGTLPVKLLEFKGSARENKNTLQWATAHEINNKEFLIERSANGNSFYGIGAVATKAIDGNSTQPIQYEFSDLKPFPGNAKYRVVQIDKDGRKWYSNTISIEQEISKFHVKGIYPVPTHDQLTAELLLPAPSNISSFVTDVSGKVLLRQSNQFGKGLQKLTLRVHHLQNGFYTLTITDKKTGINTFLKFIKI